MGEGYIYLDRDINLQHVRYMNDNKYIPEVPGNYLQGVEFERGPRFAILVQGCQWEKTAAAPQHRPVPQHR